MEGPPGVTDGADPPWVFWFNPLKEALTPVVVVCKSGPGVFSEVAVGGLNDLLVPVFPALYSYPC